MSECGDSFEEIGLMQPGLSGSASISDQESNNLNNSTMSNSTNQMNAAQLKELKFELTGKIRDEIIGNLSELTKLLSGLAVEPDARETMRKANGDLMVALLNLPVKADGRLKCSESLGQSSDDRPNHQPNDRSTEIVFELNSDVRSRIVDTLMTNHNVALLLGADSVENECKSKLIEQNSDTICELVKLRSRTVAVPSDSSTSNGDHLIEQPVIGQSASCPVVEEVAILKEQLQKIASELNKQISDQSSVIGGLEENVRDLKIKLDDSKEVVDEITVTVEIKDIESVLAGSEEEVRSPTLFYCGGIPWFLNARLKGQSGMDHLKVSLCYDKKIDRGRWRLVATFEIRLLSLNSGEVGDVIRTHNNREFRNPNEFNGWGFNDFIKVDQLRSGSFIQNDTIKLQARLTINSLERFSD